MLIFMITTAGQGRETGVVGCAYLGGREEQRTDTSLVVLINLYNDENASIQCFVGRFFC